MKPFTVSGLTGILGQLLPEPHAGLLTGLLFGTKATLPSGLYDALVRSGTIHVVALSGMNIAIMSRLVRGCLLWLVGRRISSLLTILLICWFVWFVGPSASIVRAAIMGGISLMAVLFGRQYWAIGAWVLAVAIMLLINISWLGDISFQLSAFATLGIILFDKEEPADAGRIARSDDKKHILMVNVIRRSIRDDLYLTLAAQVFTVPIILFHFHRISLIAPIANLAIGWVIAPLTGLGWVTVFLGWIALPLGQAVAWFAWVALEYVVRTIYLIGSVPFASVGQ